MSTIKITMRDIITVIDAQISSQWSSRLSLMLSKYHFVEEVTTWKDNGIESNGVFGIW